MIQIGDTIPGGYRYRNASGQEVVIGDPTLNKDQLTGATFLGQEGNSSATDPLALSSAVTRYTSPAGGGSTYDKEAAASFAPGGAFADTKPYTPDEEAKIRQDKAESVRKQIEAIQSTYMTTRNNAITQGVQALGRARALAASSGMIGSPTGDTQQGEIEKQNNERLAALSAENDAKIAQVYGAANDEALRIIENRKAMAGQNQEKYLNYLSDVGTKAKESLKLLASTGNTFEQLQAKDPQGLRNLLEQTGMSEGEAKAFLISNAPKDTYLNLDKPEIINGKAVFFRKNLDGTITSETVDLPKMTGVDPKNIEVVTRKDGIYILNKVDGTYKKVGSPEISETESAAVEAKKNSQSEVAANFGLVNQLLNNKGLEQITGIRFFDPAAAVSGTNAQLAKNQAKKLQAALSLESRQKLKGSGAISDFEFRVLSNAASSLGVDDKTGRTNLGEKQFRQELKNVKGAFGLASGEPQMVKVTNPETGESKVGPITSEDASSAMLQGFLLEFQ